MNRRSLMAGMAALGVLTTVGAPFAMADELDDLRASGALGEGFDGFAVAREDSAAAAVARINEKRRKIYQKQANKEDVPISAVGTIFAK
ncbi:MAG: DUF1318 domain-containing protein, partial [Pseudomonadota bacterium]